MLLSNPAFWVARSSILLVVSEDIDCFINKKAVLSQGKPRHGRAFLSESGYRSFINKKAVLSQGKPRDDRASLSERGYRLFY